MPLATGLKAHISTSHGPLCGRQLNNHRDQRAQVSDQIRLTSREQFLAELAEPKGKFCRHCAYAAGLLSKPRAKRQTQDGEPTELDFEE